uniref:Uncharacterized protein n=1 Tax=Salix viminalis TaxID=40686 RepID=A0A6N2N3Q7_SALVM
MPYCDLLFIMGEYFGQLKRDWLSAAPNRALMDARAPEYCLVRCEPETNIAVGRSSEECLPCL